MGGDYYDRDTQPVSSVQSHAVSSSTTSSHSQPSNSIVGQVKSLHSNLNPQRWKEDKLKCDSLNPLIFALDVTGSMGSWSKIIYDKMPMFYGQIMMKGYLTDPSISFCAIGDANTDKAPLQISEFGKGVEVDQLISKIYLEGGGGGNKHESYELAAYFYSKRAELTNVEMPFFFLTGDEGYYDNIPEHQIKNIIGTDIEKCEDQEILEKMKHHKVVSHNYSGYQIWQELKKKFNVFFIKKAFGTAEVIQWNNALGEERVLNIETPKACIDVMLGAIAITSGTRTLETYVEDMKQREQTPERIAEVTKALKKYNEMFLKGHVHVVKHIAKIDQKKVDEGKFNEIKEITEKLLQNELNQGELEFYLSLINLNKDNSTQVPEDLKCPIIGEIFYDPVMTSDGHTYERKAIEIWMEKYDYSPITKEKFEAKDILPNLIVKNLVASYIQTKTSEKN